MANFGSPPRTQKVVRPTRIDFSSEEGAAAEAQRALADMAKYDLPNCQRLSMKTHVRNEAGEEVYRASLDFKGQARKKSS
ncbi:hypothetical protein OIU35_13730 [Boseaceae bacterium BT-24-1]|nr:hypothetical protein [Boseaceae bacterium BT-24-1]